MSKAKDIRIQYLEQEIMELKNRLQASEEKARESDRLYREQSHRLTDKVREYNDLEKVLNDHRRFMTILEGYVPPWKK